MLAVSERQLRSWERRNLIAPGESFSFKDLRALRTLVDLRASKISAAQIQSVVAALREKLGDVPNPLAEVRIYLRGKRIQVQFAGSTMEPISGQFLLDFDATSISKLVSFPSSPPAGEQPAARHKSRREAERWFQKGLDLEHSGAPVAEVIAAYQKAAELDPLSSATHVNLGTVYFNVRDLAASERHYRRAIEIDPDYALAHFNLGNLFDETGNREGALRHYLAALRIHPTYADAHYNIALLYQSTNQTLKAVGHWKTYLKLDSSSEWAEIARRELAKLRDSTILQGSATRPPQE